MATCLIRDVLIVSADPAQCGTRADVMIEDTRIARVSPPRSEAHADHIIEGANRLLMPGLVNAHTHSPTNILKGTGDRWSHPAFMWRNQADTAGRSPDEVRLSAMLGCIEHLLAGTTAVMDHFPEQGFTMADVDAVTTAYRETGLRATVALRIFDEPYDDIALPDGETLNTSVANPLAPPPLADSLALVEACIARHDHSADGLIRLCPAPSNPMRCSDDLLVAVADMAKRRDTALHMHLLETKVQARIAQERYGESMVAHLDGLGVLNDRLSTAHTIWLDDDDIGRMAARGAIPVHNPESNLKLGTGISPIAKMLHAGVTVALGTDGASTNDNLDMHEVMRLAIMLQRPFEPDRTRWPGVADALAMATTAGGMAMRCAGLGTIASGAAADLVLHDLSAPSWAPLNDPAGQLVFAASGATVDTVMVAGRILVKSGVLTGFDMHPVLAEIRGLVRRQRDRDPALQTWVRRIESLV